MHEVHGCRGPSHILAHKEYPPNGMIWTEIDGRAAASTAIRCRAGCLGYAAQQERNLAKLKENNVTLRRRATVVLALSLMARVVCAQIAPAAAQPACV